MNIETNPTRDDTKQESDRIRQWRAERAAVAEAEKQERIRKVADDRDRQLAEDATARLAEAVALLPDEGDITRAQDDLHRRVRARGRRLAWQLVAFVLAPTLLVMAYLHFVAVPLYEARAVVLISKPSDGGENNLGGLLGSLGGQSNLNEAFMAEEFIRSQDMMDQLEAEMGLISFLSSDQIDPARRLRDLSFLRLSKQDQFSRFVDSSINIQTGLFTLYVRAPDPEQAIAISQMVLAKTAKQITGLSENLFQQRLDRARGSVQEARLDLSQAQSDLIQFQISSGEANPQARIASIFTSIGQLEAEKQELDNQIQEKAVVGGGKPFQTDRLVELVKRIDERIALQRRLLVDPGPDGRKSLNSLVLDYELLVLQIRVSEEALTVARQGLAAATDAAALGRSTFQTVVPPKTAENPSAPNTLLSALVVLLGLLGVFSVVKLLIPSGRL